jgi:hypothetical protein
LLRLILKNLTFYNKKLSLGKSIQMATDLSESDILGQLIFLAIDDKESHFRGSEAFGQMLGELKLRHKKLEQVIIPHYFHSNFYHNVTNFFLCTLRGIEMQFNFKKF